MTGERDLRTLLRSMRPELQSGRYVFTSVAGGEVPAGVTPVATVSEQEGLTLVVPEAQADAAGLEHHFTAGRITLRVHSALDAVGLTAAVSLALTDAGISCNVVAGYHHDHLFVPYERAAEAVRVLEALAAESR
ncbi:ACT domain-containing protein [Streptomyces sp. NBC_00178]|uniref:ACT domain-containing protein n=1 Tax=Streptomyces sp. NBC_00178 TaxID=2975672 RepID=UPI002E2C86A0|nr:ACT domain-containing protein [Streptomyces sp. NBC_00178]